MSHQKKLAVLRRAQAGDGPIIYRLICELAEYEQARSSVAITVDTLEEQLSSITPSFHTLLAEVDGQAVGFALYYYGFSTWVGKRIHLDDIYVDPAYRGHGIGRQLMESIYQIAQEEDIQRTDWMVLGWNKTAIDFYLRMGAYAMNEWITMRYEPK